MHQRVVEGVGLEPTVSFRHLVARRAGIEPAPRLQPDPPRPSTLHGERYRRKAEESNSWPLDHHRVQTGLQPSAEPSKRFLLGACSDAVIGQDPTQRHTCITAG